MNKQKIVYEDEFVEIWETMQDYDFIAVIRNLSDEPLVIEFEDYDDIVVQPNDYMGLLTDERHILNELKKMYGYKEI